MTATAIAAGDTVTKKKRALGLLLLAGLLWLGGTMPVQAQCVAKNEAFQSGEHVMYDLYFNWKFVWVKAGLASLTTNATTYHSQPAYRINLLALGSKRADFFFKMRDTRLLICERRDGEAVSRPIELYKMLRQVFAVQRVGPQQ